MGETTKYRAKATVVDAFKWDGRDLSALGEWAMHADIAGRLRRGEEIPRSVSHPIDAVSLGLGRWRVEITAPGGSIKVQVGDFIVCMPDGSFHPCKPGVFAAVFEPLAEDPS